MGTAFCGTLFLSNGQAPDFSNESSGTITLPNEFIDYRCKILKGHILLEFIDNIEEEDIDQLFRIAMNLIDNIILTSVLIEGVGLSYTLETVKKQDGEIIDATPDVAPIIELNVDQKDLHNILGQNPKLRYAIKDYNQGLTNREDCPFYFYRTIETLAKVITDEDELDLNAWRGFHVNIGTSREDMKYLHEVNRDHRHGSHTPFTEDQHLEMLRTVSYFLSQSMKFLLEREQHSPTPSEE